MAQVFKGRWTSTLVRPSGEPKEDDFFVLEIDSSGQIDSRRSTRAGQPVSGDTASGEFAVIKIHDSEGSRYDGVLIVNTPGSKVISGMKTLNANRVVNKRTDAGDAEGQAEDEKETKDGRPLESQEQIIWVATKP